MKKLMLLTLLSGLLISCSHHRRKFEHIDANNDGSISKKEWQAKWDAKFAQKDKNGDGSLSREEFGAKKSGDCKKECQRKSKCSGHKKKCSCKKEKSCPHSA